MYLNSRGILARLLSQEDLLQDSYKKLVHVVLESGGGFDELGVVAPGELLTLASGHLT